MADTEVNIELDIKSVKFDENIGDVAKRIAIEALTRYLNNDLPDEYVMMTDEETGETRNVYVVGHECRHCHTKDIHVVMGVWDNVVAWLVIKGGK